MKATRAVMVMVMVLTVALGVTLSGAPANAGHYRLPLENFVSQSEADMLAKAGVGTTLALLDVVKTAAQRKSVVTKTGLSAARVEELACQVDLLRVDGIGPGVARLLSAVGVRHTRALAGEAAGALVERMRAANGGNKIVNVLPHEAQVAAWVAAAGRLPQVLQGLP